MGTNFYCKHIPTEEEYKKMQEALTNKQLDKLEELLHDAKKEYHIGKRSCGWQFLFAPHIKIREGFSNSGQVVSPWENKLESIKEYLSRPDVIIYDEYGTEFTPEQFWNKEIGYCLYNDPENSINGEQYDKKHPNKRSGISLDSMEFTTEEGLRFSTDEDFC